LDTVKRSTRPDPARRAGAFILLACITGIGAMTSRREELKAFLRARRAAVTPGVVGLRVRKQRRRTPGLRREEVASLADVGVTWYTWLEQGRAIRVSRDALGRIAHALHLSASDTAYLLTLAADADPEVKAPRPLDQRIRLVVDSIDRIPAWAVNPFFSVVAFNRLADLIYRFDEVGGPFTRNQVWRLFADPSRKRLYSGESWERLATSSVGILRSSYAAHTGEPEFEALLSALREYPEFVRRWEAQYTAPTSTLFHLEMYREDLGRLRFFALRLSLPDLPGFLLDLLPPADERTTAAFKRLAH
jgi:transcriptional regulator with XRE-family HTH domain